MASHTDPSVGQAQEEFQDLLRYVTGPEAAHHTAYAVERTLFRRLLALGLTLLRLFFVTRAADRPPPPPGEPDGPRWVAHGRRPTTCVSVFGKLTFDRHAFSAPGRPVICPLDAALSLPARCYSDLLREWMAYGSTDAAYRETQALLERVLGQALSVQALATSVAADASDVAAFYDRPADPAPPAPLGTLLVAQADGKGVPIVLPPRAGRPARRGKGHPPDAKREAIVTALYTIAPYPRTPAAVVAALLREEEDQPRPARPRPMGKELRATLDGKDAALGRLAQRAAQRGGAAIRHRVALTDGAEALQQRMLTHLPAFTLVLDIIHASEYLWDVANALLGERHPDRTAWMRCHLEQVLGGQIAAVIAALAATLADPTLTTSQRDAVQKAVGYYRRNRPYMRYDEYLARGWPIGTGVVEGACGHLVKDRMEQAGMRWTTAGAQAVLDLRAVRLTGDWDAYWQWHRQQQHERRYGMATAVPVRPEGQVLELAA
jgi:hypothetical protein